VLFTPIELSKIPFNETEWNMQLGNDLKAAVPALKDVKLPSEVPDVPDQAQFELEKEGGGGSANKGHTDLSERAVAGLFVAVAMLFTGGALYALRSLDQAVTKTATQRR